MVHAFLNWNWGILPTYISLTIIMNGLILFIGSLTNFKLVNLLNKFMFKDKYNVIAQKVKFQAKQNPTSSPPPPFFSLLMCI